MFEKEAEDSFKCKKVLYKWETDKHSYIDGFKDGAEYVYNKCNVKITKAKELIKEMLSILPKENIEGIYEITEEAEQFLRELEE